MAAEIFRIATPVSHLFREQVLNRSILALSDCLELRDESNCYDRDSVEVFHCDLQPIHSMGEEAFVYLDQKKKMHRNLKLVTFHCASCFDRPLIRDGKFQPGGLQYSRQDLLRHARLNLVRVREVLGINIGIGIENNNYYPTEPYLHVTDGEFLCELVRENDIFLVFDMAHARITAHNRNLSYESYRDQLPLERMIQVHMSSHTVGHDGLAFDSHDLPGNDDFQETYELIHRYRVQYVTIEYYQDGDYLQEALRRLEGLKHELSRKPL